MKVLQISDSHIMAEAADTLLGVNTEYYFQQVLQDAHHRQGPFDLILFSGDLAQVPCPASYRRILAQLQVYATETLCLPGNHDDFTLMQTILNSGQVSCRRKLLKQGWQFICLHSQQIGSPAGRLAESELAFLADSLNAHPTTPTLIAVHHNCISSGSAWLDTMQISNSAALIALLADYPQVKAVTCGHVHQQITQTIANIAYFSAPATCFEFRPHSAEFGVTDTPPGYRVFELNPDGTLQSACYTLSEPLRGLTLQAHAY